MKGCRPSVFLTRFAEALRRVSRREVVSPDMGYRILKKTKINISINRI